MSKPTCPVHKTEMFLMHVHRDSGGFATNYWTCLERGCDVKQAARDEAEASEPPLPIDPAVVEKWKASIREFIVFEQRGFGVVESPLEEGPSLGVFRGTETDCQAWCEAKTLEMHGGVLTGCDSPKIWFKLVNYIK